MPGNTEASPHISNRNSVNWWLQFCDTIVRDGAMDGFLFRRGGSRPSSNVFTNSIVHVQFLPYFCCPSHNSPPRRRRGFRFANGWLNTCSASMFSVLHHEQTVNRTRFQCVSARLEHDSAIIKLCSAQTLLITAARITSPFMRRQRHTASLYIVVWPHISWRECVSHKDYIVHTSYMAV